MKISLISNKQRILQNFKYAAAALPMLAVVCGVGAYKKNWQDDEFIYQTSVISSKGTEISNALNVPDSKIEIAGKSYNAKIVVDIKTNILYLYDDSGTPKKAYKIASGKKSTPTKENIKEILTVEKYPYKSAPIKTKRYAKPWNYGPRTIILQTIDKNTGEYLRNDGQFIHGTNKPQSIGTYSSNGCIRMDNEAIKELAKQVKRGQYVYFMR